MVPLYSINDLFVCIDSPGTKVEEISSERENKKVDEDGDEFDVCIRRLRMGWGGGVTRVYFIKARMEAARVWVEVAKKKRNK